MIEGRRLWLAGGAALTVAAGVAALLTAGSRSGGGVDAGDPQQVALGRAVYAQHCASCHGAALEGQPNWRERKPDGRLPAPPHDASGHTWHHPDRQLFEITKLGIEPLAPPGYRSDMPAFKDVLSDEEIRAAIAFIKSTWPPEIRNRQEEMSRAARE